MIKLSTVGHRLIRNVFLIFIVYVLTQTGTSAQSWTQLGDDINGEAPGGQSGRAVCLSSDGLTLAIGAPNNIGNGEYPGHVRVYKLISGIWTQQGEDIDGEAAEDYSGISVSLSADGLTIAIGANLNDGNGEDSGHVRVYKLISGIWTQQGEDIDGEATGDSFGTSVSISADGLTIAAGAPENDGNGSDAGHVRVYKYISGVWVQEGGDIDGEAASDRFGSTISLSSDGLTLAAGAPFNNGNGNDAGHVRVYNYTSGSWTQQGADIDGEAPEDWSGYSVCLNADGSTLAIGAPANDGNEISAGHVRVYKFISGSWIQQGSDIDGESFGDQLGNSVSISADGLTISAGAPRGNVGNGVQAGHVKVFKFISGVWEQLGFNIEGEAFEDRSGYVSLSADGLVIAIGAADNDNNGTGAGHVKVYTFEDGVGIEESSQLEVIAIYPNPTSKIVTIDLGKLKDVSIQVFNSNGQVVYNKSGINSTTHQIELNGPSGLYILELSCNGESQRYKLAKE